MQRPSTCGTTSAPNHQRKEHPFTPMATATPATFTSIDGGLANWLVYRRHRLIEVRLTDPKQHHPTYVFETSAEPVAVFAAVHGQPTANVRAFIGASRIVRGLLRSKQVRSGK